MKSQLMIYCLNKIKLVKWLPIFILIAYHDKVKHFDTSLSFKHE